MNASPEKFGSSASKYGSSQIHSWNVSIAEARDIQEQLRAQVRLEPLDKPIKTIAGVDISFTRYSKDLYACVLVFSYPDLVEIERSCIKTEATFPYVPGYLSFREIPALLEAFKKIKTIPDLIMADGQGIAHPRRLGIATHLGIVLDVPTFGCGKSLLYGVGDEPEDARGGISYLHDKKGKDEIIGAYVRTKNHVKPVIISPGHRTTLEESIAITLETARGYRIPEPTRRTHDAVNEFRRDMSE